MISSTGRFGWGGVLCWDGVSGCRVCGGVDKDWGEVDRELGGGRVLRDIGLGGSRELKWVDGGSCMWSGVGWSRVGWVGWSRVSGVGGELGGVGWRGVGGVGGSRVLGGVGWSRVGWVGWSRVGGVGGSRVG